MRRFAREIGPTAGRFGMGDRKSPHLAPRGTHETGRHGGDFAKTAGSGLERLWVPCRTSPLIPTGHLAVAADPATPLRRARALPGLILRPVWGLSLPPQRDKVELLLEAV